MLCFFAPLYNALKNVIKHFVGSKANFKGRISKWRLEESKACQFSEEQTFLTPWYARTCAYQGVRDMRFSEYLACFAFLLPPFEIRSFALLPTIFWDIASGNYIWIFYLRRNWDQQIQNCFCVRLQSFIYNPVEHLRWLILLSPVDSVCRKAPP